MADDGETVDTRENFHGYENCPLLDRGCPMPFMCFESGDCVSLRKAVPQMADRGESATSGDFIPCWAQGRYVNGPYGLVRSTCLLEDGHLGPHEFLPDKGGPARDGDTPRRGATASCGIESVHERHLWVPRNRDYPVLCTGGEFAPYFEPGLVAIDETEATRAPTRTIKAAASDIEGKQ